MAEFVAGAIVTGGSSGIGFATARRLDAAGAQVAVVDLVAPVGLPADVRVVLGDVRDGQTIDRAIEAIGGRVGGLILCAARGPRFPNPVEIVETNHHAIVENTLACEHAFVEWASIVSFSSTAALRHDYGARWSPLVDEPYGLGQSDLWSEIKMMSSEEAYALSKWSVNQSTIRLGRRLAPGRVRVNCIAAGPTLTSMSESLRRDEPAAWEALLHESPTGLANKPDDVAGVAEWLCSSASQRVFGSFLHVDGGWKLAHDG